MKIFVVIHHDDYKESVLEKCFKSRTEAQRYLNKHHQYEDSFRVIEEVEMAEYIRRWEVQALRDAGCSCRRPLLGYRPNVGPRCRLCNTVASEDRDKINETTQGRI